MKNWRKQVKMLDVHELLQYWCFLTLEEAHLYGAGIWNYYYICWFWNQPQRKKTCQLVGNLTIQWQSFVAELFCQILACRGGEIEQLLFRSFFTIWTDPKPAKFNNLFLFYSYLHIIKFLSLPLFFTYVYVFCLHQHNVIVWQQYFPQGNVKHFYSACIVF